MQQMCIYVYKSIWMTISWRHLMDGQVFSDLAPLASLAHPLRLREFDERESICREAQEGINSKGPGGDQ